MNFKQLTDNLISRELKARYENLPTQVQKEIEVLNEMNWKDYQLKTIKRKKGVPQKGNVFLVSPREGIYFCGVVVNDCINNRHGKDLYVVLIFDTLIKNLAQLSQAIEVEELLIRPKIVGKEYWTKGYFYNIEQPVIMKKQIKYGFYDIMKDAFVDEYGDLMAEIPENYDAYGVMTISGIARAINIELIVQQSK